MSKLPNPNKIKSKIPNPLSLKNTYLHIPPPIDLCSTLFLQLLCCCRFLDHCRHHLLCHCCYCKELVRRFESSRFLIPLSVCLLFVPYPSLLPSPYSSFVHYFIALHLIVSLPCMYMLLFLLKFSFLSKEKLLSLVIRKFDTIKFCSFFLPQGHGVC